MHARTHPTKTHARTHTGTHTRTRTHTHTPTPTHTHTHARTRVRTHTHTHTHTGHNIDNANIALDPRLRNCLKPGWKPDGVPVRPRGEVHATTAALVSLRCDFVSPNWYYSHIHHAKASSAPSGIRQKTEETKKLICTAVCAINLHGVHDYTDQ